MMKQEKYQTTVFYVSWFVAVVLSTFLLWFALSTKQFTWDAWAMWDVARSFDSKPYHVAGLRQYFFKTDAGMSFPPIFPFFMWVINKFTQIGILSGLWINYFVLVTLLPALWALSKRISGIPELGAACFFALVSASCALEEFQSARTILPSLLFWVLLWNTSLSASEKGLSIGRSFCLGLIPGLGVMLRFDWILIGFFSCFIFPLLDRKPRHIVWCLCGFFAATGGWMLYSKSHFGVLFASEGMLYPFLATTTYHFDYYKVGTNFIRAWQQPVDWLFLMIGQWREGLKNLLILRYIAPLFVCIAIAVIQARRTCSVSMRSLLRGLVPAKSDLFIIFPIAIHFLTIVRHGYYQPRYLIPELVFTILYLGRLVQRNKSVRDGLASIVVPVMAVWAVVAIVFAVYFGPNRLKNDGNNAFRGDSLSQDEKAIAHKVASLNGLQGDHYSCALIFSTSTVYPQRFAALTGLRTCYDPSNSTSQVLQDFIQEWPIDFVYDPNEVTTKLPLHNVRLESLGQNLFAVHRKEES